MTEREYMVVANLARARAIRAIFRTTDPIDDIWPDEEWQIIAVALERWESALFDELLCIEDAE